MTPSASIGATFPFLGLGMTSVALLQSAESNARSDGAAMLIASRRQIDSASLGRGYLGKSTEDLALALDRRPDGLLFCRDHGGPWQGRLESSLPEKIAMARALESIRADIDAGFDLIHIDTSQEQGRHAEISDSLRRLETLYSSALEHASLRGRQIAFEIGLESQGTHAADPVSTREFLRAVQDRLSGLPLPTYFVLQTGTKVRGLANIGDLANPETRNSALRMLRDSVAVVHEAGMKVKAHNTDYLDGHRISDMRRVGVDAMNVAPEFGTTQSRVLIRAARELGLDGFEREFADIAIASEAWRAWTTDGARTTRVLLSGHYVMQDERVIRGVEAIETLLEHQDDSLRDRVQRAFQKIIDRYNASRSD